MMNSVNTVILACDSMLTHIQAAQWKMGTDFPVIKLEQKLHMVPEQMRDKIIAALEALPESVDTVLVAMGYCGGSWKEVTVPCRVVIPKMDDCITMLLHTDDVQHDNLKASGHMYFRDDVDVDERLTVRGMMKNLIDTYGEKRGMMVFNTWFAGYRYADIIDTGVYDCRSEEYLEKIRKSAELIGCDIIYSEGSNIILEKLVSGKWDDQFVVCEAGDTIKMEGMMTCFEEML